MSCILRVRHPILVAAVLGTLAPAVQATSYTFDGGSYLASGNPGTLLASDTLLINTTPLLGNPILDLNLSNAGVITVNTATLYGNGINLDNNGTFALAVDGNVLASGSAWSFTNEAGGTLAKTGGTGTSVFNTSISFVNNGGTILAQSGTLQFSGGSNTFNGGTTFSGAGTTLINGTSSFNDSLTVQTGATLNLAGALFTGASVANPSVGAVINGTVNFQGGQMGGTWTLANGGVLNVSATGAGGNPIIAGPSFNNNGTVNVGNIFYGNGVAFNNNATGVFNLTADGNVMASGGAWTFTNNGTFGKTGGTGTSVLNPSITFINNGVPINIASGTLQWAGNANTFNGGTLFTGGGTALITGATTFNDAIGVAPGTTLNLVGGSYSGASAIAGGPALLSGVTNFQGGQMVGNWTLTNGSVLNVSATGAGGNPLITGPLFNNNGTVNVGGIFYGNGVNFNNNATGVFNVTADGNLQASGSAWIFNNSGVFEKTGGTGVTAINGSINFINNGVPINIATGTVQWAGNTNTFNGGTVFAGGGTALITGNATFNDAIGVAPGTTLNLVGATYTGASAVAGGPAVLSGVANFQGGQLVGNWTVASGATLNVSATGAGGNPLISGPLFTNNGTVNVGNIFYGNGVVFDNNGVFDITADGNLMASGAAWTFNNAGTFEKTGGTGVTAVNGSINFVTGGVPLVVSSGTLQFAGNTNTFNNNTRYTGGGTVLVTGSASFNDNQTVVGPTTLTLQGSAYTGGSQLGNAAGATLNGTANFNGGTLQGTWTVANTGVLNIAPTPLGGNPVLAGTLSNSGVVNVNGDLYANGVNFTNNSGGTVNLTTDSNIFATGSAWTLNNAGLLQKSGTTGTSTISNSIAVNNLAGGTIRVNSGVLSVQTPSFTNAGTLSWGISGAGSNGLMQMAYNTSLGGSFAAVLLNGYRPTVGQLFDVMNFSSGYSGTFTNSTYTVDGVTFDAVYATNAFELQVGSVAAVPEPSSVMMLLAGLGLMGMGAWRRRR